MTDTAINNDLKSRWEDLLSEQPNLRIRNAANTLGCSEVELLATRIGEGVTLLRPEFTSLLPRIAELGYVMALTRNDDVVHERKGEYLNWSSTPHASLFVGADIDLRIFLNQWSTGWAVTEGEKGKERYSFQFFDFQGQAVHKIYVTEKSNMESYEKLISDFRSPEQDVELNIQSAPNPPIELPDDSIDIISFRNAWVELKDTHDFFIMLRNYRVSRTQALRLAPEGGYAVKVDNGALRKLFNIVAEKQIPIMVFVGNKGMIQIHTGEITNLLDRGEWFNVIDPEFNLHLRENAIAETWIVRKPTVDGMVNALELYDKNGEQLAQIFGKRKPGIPELESWRDEILNLEKETALA